MALVRSRNHSMIAGVCGGIAAWLGWDGKDTVDCPGVGSHCSVGVSPCRSV